MRQQRVNAALTAAEDAEGVLAVLDSHLGAEDPDEPPEAALGSLTYVNVATALHRLAKLAPRASRPRLLRDPTFLALEARAGALGRVPARNAANMLWAFATLRHAPGEVLWAKLQASFAADAGHATAQNVSNALWAAATLGRAPGAEALAAAERRIAEVPETFLAQNVANSVWAFAKLRPLLAEEGPAAPGGATLDLLQARAAEIAGTFNPQNVSNTAWGLAVLGAELAPELEAALRARLADAEFVAGFRVQNVANALWGLAKLGARLPAAEMAPSLACVAAKAGDLNAQNCSDLLYAFGAMGYAEGAEMLLEAYVARVDDVAPHFAADGLEGMARLGLRLPDAALERLGQRGVLADAAAEDLATVASSPELAARLKQQGAAEAAEGAEGEEEEG